MSKSSQYILTAYSFIYNLPLEQLLDVGYQSKEGNPIPSFDENLLINLCTDAEEILKNEDNVLEINGDFIIVGDIHGSFHDLLRILKFIHENNKKVLFLGDYVDRGNFSLECITLLLSMKVSNPDSFYLLRGNHEFDSLCSKYGFKDEIINHHNPKKITKDEIQQTQSKKLTKASSLVYQPDQYNYKYDEKNLYEDYYADHKVMYCYKYTELLYDSFIKTFSYLPIGAILNNSTFCIHGGLSPRLKNVDNINTMIKRPVDNFEESLLFSDVVWSDPSDDFSLLFDENPRGSGFLFSMDAVVNFLNENSLKRLIRAHQCVSEGFFLHFDDKCITVFSASSYDTFLGNQSAILQLFQKDDRIQITTFPPLDRLKKSEAFYYKVQPLNKKENRSHNYFTLKHPKLNLYPAVRMVTNTSNNEAKLSNQKSEKIVSFQHSSLGFSMLRKPRIGSNPLKSLNFTKNPLIYLDERKSDDALDKDLDC